MLIINNWPYEKFNAIVCGVYAIVGKTGKRYVGSSVNVYSRLHGHKYALKKRKQASSTMHLDYKNHGFEFFTFYLLEECSVDILREREQFYINESGEMLYNRSRLASGMSQEVEVLGVIYPSFADFDRATGYDQSHRLNLCEQGYSLEEIFLRGQARKAGHCFRTGGQNAKAIVLSNGFTFDSQKDFANICGVSPQHISQYLKKGESYNSLALRYGLIREAA